MTVTHKQKKLDVDFAKKAIEKMVCRSFSVCTAGNGGSIITSAELTNHYPPRIIVYWEDGTFAEYQDSSDYTKEFPRSIFTEGTQE